MLIALLFNLTPPKPDPEPLPPEDELPPSIQFTKEEIECLNWRLHFYNERGAHWVMKDETIACDTDGLEILNQISKLKIKVFKRSEQGCVFYSLHSGFTNIRAEFFPALVVELGKKLKELTPYELPAVKKLAHLRQG